MSLGISCGRVLGINKVLVFIPVSLQGSVVRCDWLLVVSSQGRAQSDDNYLSTRTWQQGGSGAGGIAIWRRGVNPEP
jgi:hypothetical protein